MRAGPNSCEISVTATATTTTAARKAQLYFGAASGGVFVVEQTPSAAAGVKM